MMCDRIKKITYEKILNLWITLTYAISRIHLRINCAYKKLQLLSSTYESILVRNLVIN